MVLVFGDSYSYKNLPNKDKFKVYNLSSYFQYGLYLNIIPPVQNNVTMELFKNPEYDDQFTKYFIQYIFMNNEKFFSFFRMIYDLYSGINVFVLVDRTESMDIITETFIKIIQERYGICSYLINEPDDLNGNEVSDISIEGLYNLDQDKMRWIGMTS